MYTVNFSDQSQTYDTRQDAIAIAKERSAEHRGKVIVEDETGCEEMVYVGGELEVYTFEMRRRR